ncbi:MAG: shikimate dehydrogenase [Chromatiales bacterium]|jgi:shikimate dehydrogenase|nr:shikimate dehydrogenase [Chromatiales bacterium]
MTDRYGVIGHPIAHSKSPVIHRLFAEQTGQDISYEAFDIAPEALDEQVRGLVDAGIRGLNVTVPHKQAVARLCARLSPRARLAGAVNTLVVQPNGTIEGENTDGTGLVNDLRGNLRARLAGTSILILGAGGATRGIVPALFEAGPREIVVANRTVDRAEQLAREFRALGTIAACGFADLGGGTWDLVINATSAGLQGEVPPFPPSIAGPGTLCYDLSYAMHDTPFVAWARDHGAGRVAQGWGMLVEQAAESFRLWRGVRPDTGPVIARLPGAPGASDTMEARLTAS